MKKTYTTLAGAYAAAEKANATRFDLTYNGGMVLGVLGQVYKHANKMTVAKNNLVKYEKMLCALECVHTKDHKTAYKWTVVGHFDNEGLLYANVHTNEKTEDKPKATPRTRKPKNTKGSAKKPLTKAEKTAIRSECIRLAKGNRDEYDRLCKERGVDNHR
jgi:hypothetical protein